MQTTRTVRISPELHDRVRLGVVILRMKSIERLVAQAVTDLLDRAGIGAPLTTEVESTTPPTPSVDAPRTKVRPSRGRTRRMSGKA